MVDQPRDEVAVQRREEDDEVRQTQYWSHPRMEVPKIVGCDILVSPGNEHTELLAKKWRKVGRKVDGESIPHSRVCEVQEKPVPSTCRSRKRLVSSPSICDVDECGHLRWCQR